MVLDFDTGVTNESQINRPLTTVVCQRHKPNAVFQRPVIVLKTFIDFGSRLIANQTIYSSCAFFWQMGT